MEQIMIQLSAAQTNGIITCVAVIIFFSLIAAIIIVCVNGAINLYGPNSVKKSFEHWRHVAKTQFKRNVKLISGHSLLVISLIAIILPLILFKVSPKELLDLSVASSEETTTTSTTVFATLITVLLALIALAVTAHVFLNDALLNRKDYEEVQIKNLKRHTTRRMFIICIISGLCITLCLIIDNSDFGNYFDLSGFRFSAVLLSFIDIICLVLFINSIVNYEGHLLEYARSYIEFNQYDLIYNQTNQKEGTSDNELREDVVSKVVKNIGDLETLVNSILKNHESEYRYQLGITSELMLVSITEKKLTRQKELIIDELKSISKSEDADQKKLSKKRRQLRHKLIKLRQVSVKTICKKYNRIVEIRNCIWILQDNDDSVFYDSDDGIIIDDKLNDCILDLERYISYFAFKDERFIDLNFNDTNFSSSDFSQSSLSKSALLNSKFIGAYLKNCDFSESLLQKIDMSRAMCSGAVFSGARIVSPTIDEETNFENAVFSGCEITLEQDEIIGLNEPTQIVKGEDGKTDKSKSYPYNFQRISCQKTFFSKCHFIGVNFDNAVFSNASLEESKIEECSFEKANMKEAILVSAKISRSCNFSYSDCSDIVAISSIWGDDDEPGAAYLEMTGARFVHANMAYTRLNFCRFNKAYMNDATLTASSISGCYFTGSLLSNVDFTDAEIDNSDFSHTILHNSLFIGGEADAPEDKRQRITKTHFEKAEMNKCSIKNLVFDGCLFDEAVFDGSVIRDVSFVNCRFDHARFSDVLLFNVTFKQCSGEILPSATNDISFGLLSDEINWKRAFIIN